jgi:hypothetical protein
VQENEQASNNCKYIHLTRKILHWAPKAYEHNTTRSKINSLCMNDYHKDKVMFIFTESILIAWSYSPSLWMIG